MPQHTMGSIDRMNESRRITPLRIRNLIGFSSLIMLLFCIFVAVQGSQAYRQAMQEAKYRSVKLAHILADHVELTLLGLDMSLRRAIERQYFNTLFGNNLPEYTEQNFRLWLNETPQLVALAQINEFGQVQVAAHKKRYEHWIDYTRSLADERIFQHMREADDRYVFIGKWFTLQNEPIIVMSRRFSKLNGDFGGILIAAMNPGYFSDFYESIAIGQQKFMMLGLTDGATLVSGPYNTTSNIAMAEALKKQNVSPHHEGVKLLTKTVGDSIKIAAQLKLSNMPVQVTIVSDESDFLAAWRQSRIKDIGFLAMFTIFGSILSFFAITLAKQIVRIEESEGAAILASQAKSEFLANMSHELRTPLNAIIGFSEMMSSGYFGPLNTKQKERIHDINLCGSHLLQLISDILEFSKGDAGKLELVEEIVDIGEIIDETVRIMNGKIKGKGIHLVMGVEGSLPNLWGDKRKIRQVLLNLLTNSIKFTPEGGSIRISAKLDQHNSLYVTVSDTGIGIAEEDIPRALSVFGQVHRNKSHEGTGLGLPLCKMYAELHGGKLLLTSKLSEGTTVKVVFPHQRTLPVKKSDKPTA